MNTLKEFSEKYYHYYHTEEINIESLIDLVNFTPDIIFYNHGWFSDNPNVKNIKFSNLKGEISKYKIKHILFLNKEYTRLERNEIEIQKKINSI